eukprot:TRINITY_DN806_c0_g1_i2.p1 TRINITY_DN806_c0_g1~~TRINITY_DN806_c0_g1_i2.p1  ORF type:complete len:111 (-),score=11.77 TRINITY_DN806_c0_g1_i2:77-409(-)
MVKKVINAHILCLIIVFKMKQELELQKDGEVYKLVGPVLIKQDLAEANSHVAKRIDYISSELYDSFLYDTKIVLGAQAFFRKRLEEIFSDLEKKFEAKRNKVCFTLLPHD